MSINVRRAGKIVRLVGLGFVALAAVYLVMGLTGTLLFHGLPNIPMEARLLYLIPIATLLLGVGVLLAWAGRAMSRRGHEEIGKTASPEEVERWKRTWQTSDDDD